jgi:hypothetical protein
MHVAGFEVALPLLLVSAALVAATFALPIGRSPVARLVACVVAAVVVAASTGAVAALWLVAGALYADWAIEGRPPLRSLPVLPPGAKPWAVGLLAPGWLLPNDVYRTIPVTLGAGLALLALAALPVLRSRRPTVVLVAVGSHAVVALLAAEDLNALPSLLLLGASWASLAAGAWASQPGERAGLARRLGPLAWAAPMALWSMVSIATWSAGLATSGSVGYRAWLDGISRYGSSVHEVLAATGTPLVIAGLLGVGARLALDGTRALPAVLAAAGTAAGTAAALGWLWTVQPPFG